jgi:MarR family transcriptional regulator for hemolysin
MNIGSRTPLGISLWEVTQAVAREFDRRLGAYDGNRAIWFIYLALDEETHATQRDLARSVGITEATLTHHLNNLEARGLISRDRDARDRRVQRIAFTGAGRAAFDEMKGAAIAYDLELRKILGRDAVVALQSALAVLAGAVADTGKPDSPDAPGWVAAVDPNYPAS